MKNLPAILFILALTACSSPDQKATAPTPESPRAADEQSQPGADDDAFLAYMEAKAIPDKPGARRERARKAFEQRARLAQAVAASGKLDMRLVEAEVATFRDELLISRYFDAFLAGVASEEAVQQYYEAHQDEFARTRVRFSEIVIPFEKQGDSADKSKAFDRAIEIYKRLQAGAAVDAVAGELPAGVVTNEDRTSYLDTLDSRYAAAISGMEAQQVSEPFDTKRGYHVVKLLEPPVVEPRAFEEVQGQIAYQLRSRAKQQEIERLVDTNAQASASPQREDGAASALSAAAAARERTSSP